MGQACTQGKKTGRSAKKDNRLEDRDAQTTDKTKYAAGATYNTYEKENKEVIEFLKGVSKSSFQNNTTEVRKNKKIEINSGCNNKSECFITSENIRNVYNISDTVLGKGTFGTVKEANLLANPSKKFAIKCISKDLEGDSSNFDWLYREVIIFRQLDHPNIAKLYECYQDEKHFYLVMENCNGGQLLQMVLEQKRFTEQIASPIMAQMFSAVKYLHELGIVHRDLKPENFLFTKDQQEIKMIDFGLSKQYNTQLDMIKFQLNENYRQEAYRNSIQTPLSCSSSKTNNNQTIVGTVQYIAPEVLTQDYDKRCDIWSLGVILYCILYGEFPFTGRNDQEIFEQIKKGKYSFKDDITLSKQVKELISKMICVDPNKRIDMASALKHSWFKMQNTHQFDQGRTVQLKHINNLKTYPLKLSPFQRLFIHFYHKVFSSNSFNKEHTRVFRAIDQNNEGIINTATLQKIMTSLGYNENPATIQSIVTNISQAYHTQSCSHNRMMDEYIEYSQFLEVNIDRSVLSSEDAQSKIFSYIDTQKKGFIAKEDLANCLKREGITISTTYVELLKKEILSAVTNMNQLNQIEEEDEEKIKIAYNDFQKLLNPAPPTQNNSFVENMQGDGNSKYSNTQSQQQKTSPNRIK